MFYSFDLQQAFPIPILLQSTIPGNSLQYYIAAAKSLQPCPTLGDPIDGSPPGSPVPGILQARTLEWVAWLLATPWTAAHQAPPSIWDFPDKSTGANLLYSTVLCYVILY